MRSAFGVYEKVARAVFVQSTENNCISIISRTAAIGVRVAETFTRRLDGGMRGRHTSARRCSQIAVREDGPGMGRGFVCAHPGFVGGVSVPFIKDAIEADSTVNTDGWICYLPVEIEGL